MKYIVSIVFALLVTVSGCKDEPKRPARFVIVDQTSMETIRGSLKKVYIYEDVVTKERYINFWDGGGRGGPVFTHLVEPKNFLAEKE